MSDANPTLAPCRICGQLKDADDMLPAELVRDSLVGLIEREHPNWDGEGYICTPDLNRFRDKYVTAIVQEDTGSMSDLEAEVIEAVREHEFLAENTNREYDEQRTLGDRVADHMAVFGGSWGFIGAFTVFLILWMVVNSVVLAARAFDPHPYILLNLILSCVAAMQAPVIMMSQRRLETRDRVRAENDYKVNLKAEIEVRLLGERVDRLLRHQWQRLLEIQQVQIDLMADLARAREGPQAGR